MRKPKISVITPTYKRPEMLKRAIASVLSQTEEDFEYLIVDDECSDDTRKLVKKFDDSRIRYIGNGQNPARTHCRPLNEGLRKSRGEYIAYLDDDNEWYPYHLEVLLSAFQRDKELDVAYCDMMIVGEDGELTHGISSDFDAQFLLNRNYIDTSEIMHKREVAFNIGGWDESVTRFTDWNFVVRAMKWGAKFQRVPIVATKYHLHGDDTQSARTPAESWYDPALGMVVFRPTFDPAGCYIHVPYLGDNEKETRPRVAIFTLTYERLEYTKRMYELMLSSAMYPFDWYVFDQGSTDGTYNWLRELSDVRTITSETNVGITQGSNRVLDLLLEEKDYQIVGKVDNDCFFQTKHWLSSIVDLWKRNHKVYVSPYPEGLVHNPGGAPRVGHSYIGPYFLGVTKHVGGLCAFIDSRAYENFRWKDQFKHGSQDTEASLEFRKLGYMPCYMPLHRVMHAETTEGQYKKYPSYFERRKLEKTEVA